MASLDDIKKKRADRLKRLRIKLLGRDSTAADMARRIGEKPDTYSRLESGRRDINEIWAFRLARAFGVTPDYLLYGDNRDESFANPVATRQIPLLKWKAFGGDNMVFAEVIKNAEEFIPAPTMHAIDGELCAVKMDDDSMAPEFGGKTDVILNGSVGWKPGNYVLAYVDSLKGAIFRRVKWVANDVDGSPIVDLEPLNANYPKHTITLSRTGCILGVLEMAVVHYR